MSAKPRSALREGGPSLEKMYLFTVWLVPTIEKFPRSHKFLLGDRIQRASLDVLDQLIEATYTRERHTLLDQANLGLEKLRFLFRLAMDLRILDLRRFEHAVRQLDEVGRLIGGWRKANRALHA